MTALLELYFEPVEPRWPRTRDLVTALGCEVMSKVRADGAAIGDAPGFAQLLEGHRIMCSSPRSRMTAHDWAYAAHEAVHDHVGLWSIDYEQPMLPFELELYRRISNRADRRACFGFFLKTVIDDYVYAIDLVVEHGPHWRDTSLWKDLLRECDAHGLPVDGSIGGI